MMVLMQVFTFYLCILKLVGVHRYVEWDGGSRFSPKLMILICIIGFKNMVNNMI